MTNKKTLKLTPVPERSGASLVGGATVVYGTSESVTSGTFKDLASKYGVSVPAHGFFAASPANFEGFPVEGTVEVSDSFSGSALILDNARVTPTVDLQHGERGRYILVMTGNSYITDATIGAGFGGDITRLAGNAVVKGGGYRELQVRENGYVENSSASYVYVTDRARLINVPDVTSSIFGSDAEVNFAGVSEDAKNAATELMAVSNLSWNLSDTQPFTRRAHTPPRELTDIVDTPQDMWGTLDAGEVSYLWQSANALTKNPAPDDVTLCLASTLHKKQKEHCKCMFYYGLYLLADPIALHYFARLEGNSCVASSPLASVAYGALEDVMMSRTIELEEAFDNEELSPLDVFKENLVISAETVSRLDAFKGMVGNLQVLRNAWLPNRNEALWYLNYLQVAHNITPEQFFKNGEPDQGILKMTARTRGII